MTAFRAPFASVCARAKRVRSAAQLVRTVRGLARWRAGEKCKLRERAPGLTCFRLLARARPPEEARQSASKRERHMAAGWIDCTGRRAALQWTPTRWNAGRLCRRSLARSLGAPNYRLLGRRFKSPAEIFGGAENGGAHAQVALVATGHCVPPKCLNGHAAGCWPPQLLLLLRHLNGRLWGVGGRAGRLCECACVADAGRCERRRQCTRPMLRAMCAR